MPKILLLLSEFNNVIPKWILYLNQVLFFKTHGLLLVVVIVGSCAIFRSFIFNIYTKIISNVYQQLFVVDLFSVITLLLHEKIGLKNIIKHISITKALY